MNNLNIRRIARYSFFIAVVLFIINRYWIVYPSIPPTDTPCKWPPLAISDITSNGTYNITICVKLDIGAVENAAPKRYKMSDLFDVNYSNENVTFEELAKLPRRMYKKAKYPDIFNSYPQDVPMMEIVRNITEGKTVLYEPNYNFPINILRTSTSVCYPGTKHDLVVVVKNGVYNIQERNEFRMFMKNETKKDSTFKVGFVFSVGVPRSRGGRRFKRDGNDVTLDGPAGDALEEYDGKQSELMKKIYAEINQFDDIILADYEDTYFNLSWKTVTNLRWISAFCDKMNNDFFMIIDDDHRMNLQLIKNFTYKTSKDSLRTSLFGRIGHKESFFRSPKMKYFISYHEVPWDRAPPYPRGMAQFIGADIVDNLSIATAYTKHNYLNEDVYLGMLAHKLNVTLQLVEGLYDHGEYEKLRNKEGPAIVALKKYFS